MDSYVCVLTMPSMRTRRECRICLPSQLFRYTPVRGVLGSAIDLVRAGVRPKLFGFGGDFYWIVIAAFVNVPRPNSSIFNLRETHYRYVIQNNFGLRLVGRDDRPGESGSGTR